LYYLDEWENAKTRRTEERRNAEKTWHLKKKATGAEEVESVGSSITGSGGAKRA